MSKIIKVIPTDRYFSITWKLTVRCNYDCMYCPSRWHNDTGQHHSLESLQAAWHEIESKSSYLRLPYKISFTGGELTTNRNFLPFVIWLRQNHSDKIFSLLLTTNGSASYNVYQKLFTAIDNISFSLHSEHIDEDKFFSTVIELQKNLLPGKFLHVNIMNEFWNQARIPLYQDLLSRHRISHSVNEIDYGLQTRSFPIMKGKQNLEL